MSEEIVNIGVPMEPIETDQNPATDDIPVTISIGKSRAIPIARERDVITHEEAEAERKVLNKVQGILLRMQSGYLAEALGIEEKVAPGRVIPEDEGADVTETDFGNRES